MVTLLDARPEIKNSTRYVTEIKKRGLTETTDWHSRPCRDCKRRNESDGSFDLAHRARRNYRIVL